MVRMGSKKSKLKSQAFSLEIFDKSFKDDLKTIVSEVTRLEESLKKIDHLIEKLKEAEIIALGLVSNAGRV